MTLKSLSLSSIRKKHLTKLLVDHVQRLTDDSLISSLWCLADAEVYVIARNRIRFSKPTRSRVLVVPRVHVNQTRANSSLYINTRTK